MNERVLDRIALGIAIASLLVLGIRPTWTEGMDIQTAVVRTPGASGAFARSVADSLNLGLIDLDDPAALRLAGGLHLVGWGLDAAELRRVGGRSLRIHPSPLPAGISDASWPTSIALGDEMVLRLTIAATRRTTLLLSTANGPVDSVRIPGTTAHANVTLGHRPVATGAMQYVVRAGSVADTFSVLVTPAYAPTSLLLGAAPSRELSDLRDWIARQEGSVTLRTPVSRDRSRLERLNTGPLSATPLSAPALASTAVVITDGRGLLALSPAERRLVRGAVESGAGLILTLDDAAREPSRWTPEDRRTFFPWRVVATEGLDERQVRPRIDGRQLSATPVEAEGAVFGTLPFGASAIFDDGQGEVIAALSPSGRGRVVATVVTGTGRWLRSGEANAFGGYWQTLIRAAARPDPRSEWLEIGPGPVMVDRALTITRPTSAGAEAVVGGDTVRFSPDPLSRERSVARWWPRATGWNDLAGQRVWVSDTGAWHTWRAAERSRLTYEAAATTSFRNFQARAISGIPVRTPWPLWPFFLLFVMSSGWCWRRVGLGS